MSKPVTRPQSDHGESDHGEPHHGTSPSQGEHDDQRLDAGGYDTQPPPAQTGQTHPNLGNQDDPAPEREGWREFDANVEWQGDTPYPAEDFGPEPETTVDATGDAPADLLIAATEALDRLHGIDTGAITVEQRGDTLYLRGRAASQAQSRHAEQALLRIRGVGRVENLLDTL